MSPVTGYFVHMGKDILLMGELCFKSVQPILSIALFPFNFCEGKLYGRTGTDRFQGGQTFCNTVHAGGGEGDDDLSL